MEYEYTLRLKKIIRQKMTEKDWNKTETAFQAGITNSHFTNFLNNPSQGTTFETAMQICKALGIGVDFSGEEMVSVDLKPKRSTVVQLPSNYRIDLSAI